MVSHYQGIVMGAAGAGVGFEKVADWACGAYPAADGVAHGGIQRRVFG